MSLRAVTREIVFGVDIIVEKNRLISNKPMSTDREHFLNLVYFSNKKKKEKQRNESDFLFKFPLDIVIIVSFCIT